MEINLEKQVLDMQLNKQQLEEKGYIILKNFFDKEYIETLRHKAEDIFKISDDLF